MPKKQRESTLAIALELLALASSMIDGCGDDEDEHAYAYGSPDTGSTLHSAADDIQEVIGNVKQETYGHENNQL